MDKADAAVYCSQLYAWQASGTMHAFSRQVRTHTPWGNGRPTFYNIEPVEILNRDANAKMVFHYNANNGKDVWYNSHHYTNCATPPSTPSLPMTRTEFPIPTMGSMTSGQERRAHLS